MGAADSSGTAPVIRHAAVSGASGFIGRHLCQELQRRGIEVTAVHRHAQAGPWNHQRLVDLGSEQKFSLPADVDSVFHLAGFAHAEPQPDADALHRAVTVHGTARLIEACARNVERFVYFSSVKAMGESTPTCCIDESTRPEPSTPYGRARLAAEQLVLQHAQRFHTAILRLPLVYGAGVKGNLSRLLSAVRKRRAPLLPEFANRRSMVHVDDVVSAALAAAQHPIAAGRVYLLCDGQRYSTRSIQLAMYRAVGVERPRLRIPRLALNAAARLGDVLQGLGMTDVPLNGDKLAKLSGSACYDTTRAREELDWHPRYSLEDALPAMLDAVHEATAR